MSKDKPSKRTPIQRAALAVVRSEMHLYDHLSARPRYRVEPPCLRTSSIDDNIAHGRCAHDHALHDVCSLCERNEEDCKLYRRAASVRLKALLKQLGE